MPNAREWAEGNKQLSHKRGKGGGGGHTFPLITRIGWEWGGGGERVGTGMEGAIHVKLERQRDADPDPSRGQLRGSLDLCGKTKIQSHGVQWPFLLLFFPYTCHPSLQFILTQ